MAVKCSDHHTTKFISIKNIISFIVASPLSSHYYTTYGVRQETQDPP